MASDFSRKTFDRSKNYSGVLMQQGRVQLDADWNEQLDIEQHRTHTETRDVIGESGAPKKGNHFKIASTNSAGISISEGHIYVGGLLCELKAPCGYDNQPYYPKPDMLHFPATTGNPPLKPGNYLVYLEAWQREVNHLDDPRIREVALGEADTATRLQTVWQVKPLSISNAISDCKTDPPEWSNLIKEYSGKLDVQTNNAALPENLCALPPQSGYRRLENQLYRVEVQKGGNLGQVSFKWSRENASVETKIEAVSGNIVTVADTGKDKELGFAPGQWVEIVNEESTLKSEPKILRQILDPVDYALRKITLSGPAIVATPKMKLRRWDHTNGNADGLLATGGWQDLEGGIQVKFSNGVTDTYRAGDYWLIPARAAIGKMASTVEWVPDEEQLPHGTKHFYCKLALVNVTAAGGITVQDCRPKFPSLTEICAEDICYNPSKCNGSTAKTVQEALDELCRMRGGACTYVAMPGSGWESVFNQVAAGMDAQICFLAGHYPMSAAFRVTGKGHLKLIGAGQGTRITAASREAGLIFDNCKSVLVRDLYAETGNIQESDLNGALNFDKCPEVQVDTVDLKCGQGSRRAATCLTVRDAGVVRISNCDLQIGEYQQGILLVNAAEAFVQNNVLKVYPRPANVDPAVYFADDTILNSYNYSVKSQMRIADMDSQEPLGERNVSVSREGKRIDFKTPPRLKNAMRKLLNQAPASKFKSDKSIARYLEKEVNKLFLDEVYRSQYPDFMLYYDEIVAQSEAVASQGITVGGTVARNIIIRDNTLEGMLQGIHVGVSHHAARNVHDHCRTVQISGNSIGIKLPSNGHKLGRHGIFVGNCEDLIIENNSIRLTRLLESEWIDIDGIRVWGILGDRLMITKNYVASADKNRKRSFNIGIRVNPLIPITSDQQWTISFNVAPSIDDTIAESNGADDYMRTNTPLPS